MKAYDPFASMMLGFEMMKMTMEAQSVIALRTAGAMGFWAIKPAEYGLMLEEKQQAAALSFRAAGRAAMKGGNADDVLRAGLKPIGRRTASNVRRLGRLGFPSICG